METLTYAIELFSSISATSDKARAKSSRQESTDPDNRSYPHQFRDKRDKNLPGEPQHATRTESDSNMVGAESAIDETSLGRDVDRPATAKHNLATCANVEQRFSQSDRDARTESADDKTVALASHVSACYPGTAEPDACTQIAGTTSRLCAVVTVPRPADLRDAA